MSAQAQAHDGVGGQAPSLAEVIDRWLYVLMALFLIAVILLGFVPDSFARIADIDAGGRALFLWEEHFHALTMASWMALLLTQTVLMATGRGGWHMQLGVLGMVLAPVMVVAGVMLVPAVFESRIADIEAAGPAGQAELAEALRNMTNTVLVQLRAGFCFLVLAIAALVARRRDAGLHKRLMILATIAPIGAALARMPFLWQTQPEAPTSTLLWPAICVVPMLLWDIYRQRAIHRDYWIFLAVTVSTGVAVAFLWNSA